MEVFIEKEQRTISESGNCTGTELLKKLGINETTVLLVRNGEVVLEEEKLDDTDKIQILSVVSGG